MLNNISYYRIACCVRVCTRVCWCRRIVTYTYIYIHKLIYYVYCDYESCVAIVVIAIVHTHTHTHTKIANSAVRPHSFRRATVPPTGTKPPPPTPHHQTHTRGLTVDPAPKSINQSKSSKATYAAKRSPSQHTATGAASKLCVVKRRRRLGGLIAPTLT